MVARCLRDSKNERWCGLGIGPIRDPRGGERLGVKGDRVGSDEKHGVDRFASPGAYRYSALRG